MSQSSSTWMTFLSTLAICPNTRPMFSRYSEDSELMDSLSKLISVSFTSPLVNTLDMCYHLKALPWHHTKSRLSRIGPNLEKLKTFNHSSVLPTSTNVSFMDTLKSPYPSCVLPKRVQFGTSLMSADRLSKHLKKAFTTAPVLTHWIPDTQIMVETNTSDYALATVLSITTPNGELHPIALHSQTFSALELNYDVHDKELLAIFEAFKQWWHYLEGSALLINVVTDHRNLQYFSMTNILTWHQAHWSKYLLAFNLVISFRPGKFGTKPNAL